MRMNSSLFVALVAGSVASVASGQVVLEAKPARGPAIQAKFAKATANGRKLNLNGHTNVIDAVQVYDNDGTAPFYSTNGLAGMAGDHCKLTPGPGSGGPVLLTSIDTISFIGNGPSGYAGGTLDIILDIYDTYTTTASPINTGPLLHFVATTAVLPPVPAGTYYLYGPLDITAANVTVPDDDFVAVVRVCNTGTTVAATGVMPTFCGLPYPLLTGASEDNFLYDVNNNGIFEGAGGNVEWAYWFGGADPFHANIYLSFSGTYQGQTGACCLPDSTCSITSSINCTQLAGTYQGNGSVCGACGPVPTGRCCKPDGTCTVISQFDCTAAHGVYGGNNSVCGTCVAFGYVEGNNDAGELPETATVISGNSGTSLTNIWGALSAGDADMYKINICDRTTFTASTIGGAGGADTQMFLFNSAGVGLTMDDDNVGGPESNISGQFVVANGNHYLALSLYNRDPIDSQIVAIWANTNPGAAYYPEWAPNGSPPSATNVIASWVGSPTTTANYNITLTGACFVGASCYANCDGSTSNPLLTANDFQCFLNEYAAGHAYANCDGSTNNPVLTANDFQCFLNSYAAGCT